MCFECHFYCRFSVSRQSCGLNFNYLSSRFYCFICLFEYAFDIGNLSCLQHFNYIILITVVTENWKKLFVLLSSCCRPSSMVSFEDCWISRYLAVPCLSQLTFQPSCWESTIRRSSIFKLLKRREVTTIEMFSHSDLPWELRSALLEDTHFKSKHLFVGICSMLTAGYLKKS